MSDKEDVGRSRRSAGQRWLRRLTIGVGALAVVVVLVIVLLPVAIRHGAISWLEEHGAERPAVNNVDLNPFAGIFVIEGVSAGDGLKVERLEVDIDWLPILSRRISVHSLAMKGIRADFHQLGDGSWQLATIKVDEDAAGSAGGESPQAPAKPWQFVFHAVEISNVSLKMKGMIKQEDFNLSLQLNSLKISLTETASGAGWLLKNSVVLGKSGFNGLGYDIENEELRLKSALLLPERTLDFSNRVHLKHLTVPAAQLLIRKLKSEKDSMANSLSPKDAASSAAVPAKADAADGPAIYIDEFVVGQGASLVYRDESRSPPFETKVSVDRFTFSPLDLSGGKAGNLDARFELNKKGSLAIEGELLPSAAAASADLKLSLKNFDMTRLSSFVESGFGRAIKTGQLDLNSTVKIAANNIDARNRLTIRKLKLENMQQSDKAEKKLGMPIDMALDMLRDDRGDIAMDVPVSGRLDDPDIDTGDVINKALVSSISSGALTIAKLALQPYGTIWMATEFAVGEAKKAAKPKLTPIRFNDRSATLEADMGEYTVKIAALMKQKDFSLQICGVATRIEGGGGATKRPQVMDNEQLLNLAESRSDAVIQAIQAQGISADRLFNCRSSIDEKIKGVFPRVDMILD